MIISGFEGTTLDARTEELIVQQGIGGLILFERNYKNPDQLLQLTNDLQSLTAGHAEIPPLFISVDQKEEGLPASVNLLHSFPLCHAWGRLTRLNWPTDSGLAWEKNCGQ